MATKTSIKTKMLGGNVNGYFNLTTTVGVDQVADVWVPQTDIRIVGAEVVASVNPVDAHANADGAIQVIADLTRAGLVERDGSILAAAVYSTWTGILVLGGNLTDSQVVAFPSGHGIDIFNGDSVNLYIQALWTGAGGVLAVMVGARVHYIER